MEAIVQHQDKPLKPTTPRAIVLADALREDSEQRIILKEYVEKHMIKGTDYGIIPGTKLPTLLKPGAEKLMDLFRCRPEYETMARDVDRDCGLYSFEIRCKAVSRETDTVLNEGVGSASSYESKYRYRSSARKCPKCAAEAIKRSQFPPRNAPRAEPGWYCHAKAGGCGANFAADDKAIVEQTTGKIQNPDLADVANTVLKMAKKRAQVDCAIALARVSDMFTQDVEDLAAPEGEEAPSPFRPEADATQRAAEAIVEQVEAVTAQSIPDHVKPLFEQLLRQAEPKGPNGTHTPEQIAYSMKLLADAAGAILPPGLPMDQWTQGMTKTLTRHFFGGQRREP